MTRETAMIRIFIFVFIILFFLGCQNCIICPSSKVEGAKTTTVQTETDKKPEVQVEAAKSEKPNVQVAQAKTPQSKSKSGKKNKKISKQEQELETKKFQGERIKELRFELKKTPLFEKWYYSLAEERVRQIYYAAKLLLVESESKKLFAFDGKTGIIQWVYTLPESLDFRPEIVKDRLYFLAMAKLYTLDKSTGSLLKQTELSFIPSSPLCIGDKYIYLGAWDNFLYALDKEDGSVAWRYRIDGIVQGQPVVSDGLLFFPGTDQKIYAINAESGYSLNDWGKESRYETRAANVAGIHAESNPPSLYIGSVDYNFYSLNRVNGDLRWKFESGGEIRYKPYQTAKTIYFSAEMIEKKTLFYGLDIQNGDLKTTVENGILFFFVGQFHDFIVRNDKKIVAVSRGNQKQSLYDFKEFDYFVSNPEESNLGFIATKDAFIFAVEEK